MKKLSKRVQAKPFTFDDWWNKEGNSYGVESFKACRAAWNAARGIHASTTHQPKEKQHGN